MNETTLSYNGERDKVYGLTGMAVTLVALDGEKYLYGIDIDAPAYQALQLGGGFGLKGNPRMSARILWEQAVGELRLHTSMALGNIVCRRYILGHTDISDTDIEPIRQAVHDDASAYCSLDDDEAERLFGSCLDYARRLFRHSGVQQVVHSFAGRLSERRCLSGAETVEILASLGLS